MKQLLTILALILMLSCTEDKATRAISLAQLENTFSQMKADGIDTNSDLTYGYFFTNNEPSSLQKVAEELQQKNFELVQIYQNGGYHWLHMQRVETHDAASLFALNEELYQLAEKYELDSYDGFDVGR